jgi:hypothetical protein
MRRRGWCLHSLVAVVLTVLPLSTAWCIPHLGVNCTVRNSNKIRAIAHSTNSSSSSHNNSNHSSSSSSTVLLLHPRNRLPSSHYISLPPATFHASTIGRLGTLRINAANPSKATRHELRHPWSTNKGATKGVLHHRLAVPTTPPWMSSPREKKC